MDILKTGIGLRGYNQKDPLVEYKKESYNLFMELVSRLKSESVKTLQVVRFKSREEQEEQARMMLEASQNAENENLSYNNQGEDDKFTPEKKIPRNAPCPCGSGKKYKDCHGKSGPKKGIFA
jgi:protein translocase subunit secA